MKTLIETLFAFFHLVFGVLAFTSYSIPGKIISGTVSILLLVAIIKIADYDIYIIRENNGNHKTAKV